MFYPPIIVFIYGLWFPKTSSHKVLMLDHSFRFCMGRYVCADSGFIKVRGYLTTLSQYIYDVILCMGSSINLYIHFQRDYATQLELYAFRVIVVTIIGCGSTLEVSAMNLLYH